MKQQQVGPVSLYFDPGEEQAASMIAGAIEETSWILRSRWSLGIPPGCSLVVMTFWRVRAMWPVAGGWTNRFGRRVAVGVKPPSLLAQADRRIGERIFIHVEDPLEKVRQITCHELTHAATAALKLPMWLNEGLATRAVDHLTGSPTIRLDTLELLSEHADGVKPLMYRNLRLGNRDAVVYEYVRGYWLIRLLDEHFPDALAQCLVRRSGHALESIVAEALDLSRDRLWGELNPLLRHHFAPLLNTPRA
jgi:hypothetical protein